MQEENELDSTVPTDMTISSFSDDEVQKWKTNKSSNVKRNFAKDIQLLKLELIRKNFLVQSLQNELEKSKRIFDEKVKDVSNQKKTTETVLKTKFDFMQETLKCELNIAKGELYEAQQKNKTLEEDIQNLKFCLDNLDESGSGSEIYSTKNLSDFVMYKIHEREKALKKERDSSIHEVNKLQTLISKLQESCQNCKQELQEERANHLRIRGEYDKLLSEHTESATRIHHRTFAQENFQRIKIERDQLYNEVLDLKKRNDGLKAEMSIVTQSKEDIKQEIYKLKQDNTLLQRECEAVSEQLSDVMQRWGESQDKVTKLQAELDQTKSSREDLMERFMRSKDLQRVEFEERLIFEKRQLSAESKLAYEQEIRALNEAKNSLFREKHALEVANSELKRKYEQLHLEYDKKRDKEVDFMKKLQRDATDQETKIRSTEKLLNQLEIRYEVKCKDYDKVNTKLRLVEDELKDVKKSLSEKCLKLETELGVSKARLEVLEKMENEMNALVDEVAEIHDPDLDQHLGDIVHHLPPASAKLSFIRNVHLTRKIAELEKKLQVLYRELEEEKSSNLKLQQEAGYCENLLSQVEQPYSYLLETIKQNEQAIQELTKALKRQKEELESVLKNNSDLEKEKRQLINDLEVLLQNRQEILNINKEIETLKLTNISSIAQPSTTTKKLKNSRVQR